MHRANKWRRKLPHWRSRRNELIDLVRRSVEKVFGTLKRSCGYSRVRYRGLERNGLEMWFKLMAYNLRRAERIVWGESGGELRLPAPLGRRMSSESVISRQNRAGADCSQGENRLAGRKFANAEAISVKASG